MPLDNEENATKPQETAEVIELLALTINTTIMRNRRFCARLTLFGPGSIPSILVDGDYKSIQIGDYLKQFALHLDFEGPHYIVMLIYLERYLVGNSDFVHDFNVHRLLVTCLRIGHKFLDDKLTPISEFSKISGIPARELTVLEMLALEKMGFNAFVSEKEYLQTKQLLIRYARVAEQKTSKKYLISFGAEEEATLAQLKINPLYVAPDAPELLIAVEDSPDDDLDTANESTCTTTSEGSSTPSRNSSSASASTQLSPSEINSMPSQNATQSRIPTVLDLINTNTPALNLTQRPAIYPPARANQITNKKTSSDFFPANIGYGAALSASYAETFKEFYKLTRIS